MNLYRLTITRIRSDDVGVLHILHILHTTYTTYYILHILHTTYKFSLFLWL